MCRIRLPAPLWAYEAERDPVLGTCTPSASIWFPGGCAPSRTRIERHVFPGFVLFSPRGPSPVACHLRSRRRRRYGRCAVCFGAPAAYRTPARCLFSGFLLAPPGSPLSPTPEPSSPDLRSPDRPRPARTLSYPGRGTKVDLRSVTLELKSIQPASRWKRIA